VTGRNFRVHDYLAHILEAIDRIERYIADVGYEDFVGREMVQDAVVRNLEIIGEACRNIERSSPDFAGRHPDLPLKAASEMRNALAHGYFGVDLAIVWRTIRTDLPALRQQAQEIIREAGQN